MTLTLWKNNRLPVLTDTITAEGTAVDLTASTVKFKMRPAVSDRLTIDAAATVVSAAAGTVSYPWATVDTDTVGSFLCWWEVTTSAKTQDTPEFALLIVEHAPPSVDTPTPVGAGGQTTIFQGDAYLDADQRALQYEIDLVDMKDLTGLTVTLKIAAPSGLSKAMTVTGIDAVKVDLSSTETATLAVGTHQFSIVVTTSAGNFVTLLHSTFQVLAAPA